MRIGISKDIHRLVKGRPLILGGVKIDHDLGLLGHSDADVVFHAVSEAIYGALALGDLGTHFSDKDPSNKNLNSEVIVKHVVKQMNELNYEVSNLDVQIVCESPKLAPYILKMRENIAKLLFTKIENISIKATTNEGLGPIGQNEAIEAVACVLLKEKN